MFVFEREADALGITVTAEEIENQLLHESAAFQDAEGKFNVVKQWNRQYDQRIEPLGKQVEKLRHNLVHDLGLAIAFLAEVTKTLAEYTELRPAGSAPKPPPETGNAT